MKRRRCCFITMVSKSANITFIKSHGLVQFYLSFKILVIVYFLVESKEKISSKKGKGWSFLTSEFSKIYLVSVQKHVRRHSGVLSVWYFQRSSMFFTFKNKHVSESCLYYPTLNSAFPSPEFASTLPSGVLQPRRGKRTNKPTLFLGKLIRFP